MKTTNQVVIKSLDDNTAVVAGYGVIYGGEDLEGETFVKDTDFMLDLVPSKLVFYDHTLQAEVKHMLGNASVTPDENGLWVEAQLDRHKAYVNQILDLVEKGILGWSSGSIGHLVEREGKTIKRWPIVEFSLTPTPAEPRTLGVERLKALAKDNPDLKALISQGTGKAPRGANQQSPHLETMETKTMSDVTLSMEEYKDLLKMQVKAPDVKPEKPVEAQDPQVKAISEKLQALTEMIEKSPVMKDAGYVAPDSEEDHPEAKSLGDFLIAVRNNNSKRIKSVYKTAMAEDAGATGGYLVPTQFVQPMIAASEPFSVLRRAGATVIPMTGKTAEIPALDIETAPSAGDTAFSAGVVAYWEGEADTLTESEPRFRMLELVAHKLAGYSLASNEVRQDAAASVESLLTTMFGRAIGSKENYAFFRGDGVGKPLGILNSGALISATRSAASAIALDDLGEMMSDFLPSSWGSGAWFINPTAIQKLIGLVSSPLSWLSDIKSGLPVQLLGMPLYVTGALPGLNTAGDILLVDPSYYLIGDRQQISIAYSEHYAFVTDQAAWRFTYRVDGQPWVNTEITLEDASTQVSPYCALAAG